MPGTVDVGLTRARSAPPPLLVRERLVSVAAEELHRRRLVRARAECGDVEDVVALERVPGVAVVAAGDARRARARAPAHADRVAGRAARTGTAGPSTRRLDAARSSCRCASIAASQAGLLDRHARKSSRAQGRAGSVRNHRSHSSRSLSWTTEGSSRSKRASCSCSRVGRNREIAADFAGHGALSRLGSPVTRPPGDEIRSCGLVGDRQTIGL